MCGVQVWVTACGSFLEERLLSMTLWWDALQTTDHSKEEGEAFSKQSEEGSVSQTHILTGKLNTRESEPSRRLLDGDKDNSLLNRY